MRLNMNKHKIQVKDPMTKRLEIWTPVNILINQNRIGKHFPSLKEVLKNVQCMHMNTINACDCKNWKFDCINTGLSSVHFEKLL